MKLPWQRRARERELNEELQAHLRMATELRIQRGESPAETRSNALREFGNPTRRKRAELAIGIE